MTAHLLKTHALPALLSGTRNGLSLDKLGLGDKLQALSLAGQALRFDRPPTPAQYAVEDKVADTRTVIPDAMRRPLLRLLTAKASGLTPNAIPAAIARTLDRHRWRLHPFDLPRLDSFVAAHADQLGAEAQAFAQRDAAPEATRGYFDPDALDDQTWTLATPAARQAYIATRRRGDPAAARALVETAWATENADIRVRLLGALRERLETADAPFLESLAKDRAPRVRDLAQRLLARLPGHDGDHPALRNAIERIKTGQTGLLRKRTTLSLELPATIQLAGATAWVHETFADIGLDQLARALSLGVPDMIQAAEKHDNLLFAFVIMATGDTRFDVLETLVGRHVPDAWERLVASGFDGLDDLTPAERRRWADIVVRPLTWVQDMPVWGLIKLYKMLEGPVSDTLMRDLMKARPWLALLKDDTRLQVDIVDALAVLCPPALRPAFRAQITVLDPAKTTNALTFLDIMAALDIPTTPETDHV